ncbi:ABC transporter ATP-binding protein [Phycisphaerales bacterium AB-hyl4]|uniref:ABC transporter ATP-binding protein n=1 Tax=Natronomicrosphaera hydrolytica TaxID=3242702 RepID=A0ABV4U914_9BACT
MSETQAQPILEIRDLSVSFPAGRSARFMAVDGVNLSVYPRQTLAVVGESGSGKSVSAMSVLQLIPIPPGRYERGQILWQARPTAEQSEASDATDLLKLSDRQMRKIRGKDIAMIFQEPMTSLNPVYTIGDQILEAILLHQAVGREQAVSIATRALSDVGIADPTARLREYPHQLSGGMRQRVMIAMALACQPRLLLADEPTTALDVTIQAQILELLRHLQNTKDMSVLLITHDLGVVAENADSVAVMYSGRVLEYGSVMSIFQRPLHPYTNELLKSMPVLGRHADRLPTVRDGATAPDDFPPGYDVAPHQVEVSPGEHYGGADAKLHEVEPEHWVLCKATTEETRKKATLPRVTFRREPVGTDA